MKIAIISPATEVKEFYIDGAVNELRHRGHIPVEGRYDRGPRCGTFASSDANRLDDLKRALLDPQIKAILCARGGYGCVHLLSKELEEMVRENPKWLIGFSDVSALHALWRKAGVQSIHCSMAKQLSLYAPEQQPAHIYEAIVGEIPQGVEKEQLEYCTDVMFSILESDPERTDDDKSCVSFDCGQTSKHNAEGMAEGEIIGGNLAVLNGLAGTRWDLLSPENVEGKILFLEDIGEKIYQIERMLKRLQLCGTLDVAAGLIFGKFTEYQPDRNFSSMEEMIATRLMEWGILTTRNGHSVSSKPIAFNVPIGHQSYNLPIIEGAQATLSISADGCVSLTQQIPSPGLNSFL